MKKNSYGGPQRVIVTIGTTKFGRLTAIEELSNRKGARIFLWKCDCGQVISRDLSHVKSSKNASCGCYIREMNKRIRLESVQAQRERYDSESRTKLMFEDTMPGLNKYLRIKWG